jgi:hypothetical protein
MKYITAPTAANISPLSDNTGRSGENFYMTSEKDIMAPSEI